MNKEVFKQALNTEPPYVGRARPKQPTSRQLELLEIMEAIDKRSNRVWNTGRPKPVSRLAEDYKTRMGFESSEQTQKEVYEPES